MKKVHPFLKAALAGLFVCVLSLVPEVVRADSIQLQNGTATFSESGDGILYSPDQAIDGNFGDSNGWGIVRFDGFGGTTSEIAVWETATDLTADTLVFTMHFLQSNPGHLLGRFRFSVTTDDRSTFADGLRTGGDVDANWIVLTNPIVSGPVGMTFTTLSDHSVLAGGTTAAQGIYTVIYSTTILGITGVRLEALEHPSLPGGNGPGLFPRNGNFGLTELQLNTTPAPPDQCQVQLDQCQQDLAAAEQDIQSLENQVGALTAQNAQLQQAVQDLQNQLTQLTSVLTNGLISLTNDFRSVFNDPTFVIPGATLEEQYQSLITAILNLNEGRKQGVYVNLGGKPGK